MPFSFFEIEYSTDFQNSLSKFYDLQDFYSNFFIVSSKERKKEFNDKLNRMIFESIRKRVKFIDYEYIASVHAKLSELNKIGGLLRI